MLACRIRPATREDAAAAVAVLRDSITHLCVADHRNDPATLERWLRNKTTASFLEWLALPDAFIVVADVESAVCGVGAVRNSGDLDLCYVQPGRHRAGVGAAILQALEARAAAWGLAELRLISTATARAFYERHGYVLTGEQSVSGFGLLRDYRYVKVLGARPPAASRADG